MPRRPTLELVLGFGIWDWHNSSNVQISIGQTSKGWSAWVQAATINSEPLKHSPPEHTTWLVAEEGSITTGSWQPLARIGEDVVVSIVLVAREDVVVSHSRWRIAEDIGLSPELDWLWTGRRSGERRFGR